MAWPPRVVLDTNVVIAGLRSNRGASYLLLAELGRGNIEIALSVPLILEYEDALGRNRVAAGLSTQDVEAVLDFFCSVARLQRIFYLWRPLLPDPSDDMVLEVAVAAQCSALVTHNIRDFVGADQLGVRVLTPAAFLRQIGVVK
jgi:putative PIN family toxin of toxin-antitoxin system